RTASTPLRLSAHTHPHHARPAYFPLLLTPTPSTPISTLFPYPTLFRSHDARAAAGDDGQVMPGEFLREVNCGFVIWISGQDAKRSEEHTSELQSLRHLVCRLLLEKKKSERYLHKYLRNEVRTISDAPDA